MTRRTFLAASAAAAAAPPARSAMGLSPDCFGISRAPREAYDYLQYGWERGAGGVQAVLSSTAPDYLKKVRERAERLGMYLEISTNLPKEDDAAFEATVKAAKEAGALCLRSVCLGSRRYETFNSLAEFQAFAADSRARLARAVRIVERNRIALGIENHKDWTIGEMVPLLKSYSSEYLGTCIDWGNSISLCDDPLAVAEALAPFAVNSHIKDMAVEEYADGFLLADVPMGQGMLPLKSMLAVIQKARPKVRYSLDLLTRNPLLVPCLTEKYWASFAERNGVFLARTLRMVRAHKPARPLIEIDGLDQEDRVRLEQANVRQSLDFARDELGLRVL